MHLPVRAVHDVTRRTIRSFGSCVQTFADFDKSPIIGTAIPASFNREENGIVVE